VGHCTEVPACDHYVAFSQKLFKLNCTLILYFENNEYFYVLDCRAEFVMLLFGDFF